MCATLGVSLSLCLDPRLAIGGLGYMAILLRRHQPRAHRHLPDGVGVAGWRSYMSGGVDGDRPELGADDVGGNYAVDAKWATAASSWRALITACGALLFWSIFVRNQPARHRPLVPVSSFPAFVAMRPLTALACS